MLYPETGLRVSRPICPHLNPSSIQARACLKVQSFRRDGTTKPFRLIGSPWLEEVRLAKDPNPRNARCGVSADPFHSLVPKYNGGCAGAEAYHGCKCH